MYRGGLHCAHQRATYYSWLKNLYLEPVVYCILEGTNLIFFQNVVRLTLETFRLVHARELATFWRENAIVVVILPGTTTGFSENNELKR